VSRLTIVERYFCIARCYSSFGWTFKVPVFKSI